MVDQEIRVYKKIVWGWDGVSKARIMSYKLGDRVESPTTKIVIGDNITEWSLCFYPGGHSDEYKDSIALCLSLSQSSSTRFETEFSLGIVGKQGNAEEGELKFHAEAFKEGQGLCLLKILDFLTSSRGYLTDGKVTLYCKLTLTAKEVPEDEKRASLNQNHLNDFGRMFYDEIFADFKVETSDKKVIKVHKNVLAFRSSYFFVMLTTDMKEAQDNIVMVPEDYIIMKEVLRFIYSNEVESLNLIACELVFAAEKYQLDDLKALCIDSIMESLSIQNVLNALLASDRLTKSEKLKHKCIELIESNFQFISKSKEWKNLPQSLVLEMTCRTIGKDGDTIYL